MMEIKEQKTSKLIPYINNARTHDESQILQIASSIKEFGFTNPVLVDESNGIIAGHGRLQAAKLLDLDTIPTIELTGLTQAQKKAYVIADNQLALNAGWDLDLLKLEVEALQDMDFDIELLGFDDELLESLSTPEFEPVGEDEQGKLDELDPKFVSCPHCGKEFDLRDNGQV